MSLDPLTVGVVVIQSQSNIVINYCAQVCGILPIRASTAARYVINRQAFQLLRLVIRTHLLIPLLIDFISLQGVCETRDIDQRLFTVYDQSQKKPSSSCNDVWSQLIALHQEPVCTFRVQLSYDIEYTGWSKKNGTQTNINNFLIIKFLPVKITQIKLQSVQITCLKGFFDI